MLERSRPLILDPLAGHPEAARHITDADLRGTLKELAQLDGAFVISDEGVVVAACRYLVAITSDIDLSLGLGSRHFAAASISKVTKAIGIVVSEIAVYLLIALGCLRFLSVFQIYDLSNASDEIRHVIHRELIIRSELYRLCIRSAIIFTIVVVAVLPILYFYSPGKPA